MRQALSGHVSAGFCTDFPWKSRMATRRRTYVLRRLSSDRRTNCPYWDVDVSDPIRERQLCKGVRPKLSSRNIARSYGASQVVCLGEVGAFERDKGM